MKNLLFFSLMLTTMPLMGVGQEEKPAYGLFDSEGNAVGYQEMIDELEKADVVFFGEQHNDPIAHWLQLEVTKSLYEKKQENLVLGAEMFEADDQLLLNEYLSGTIREKDLDREGKLWPNYGTDYKPLVDFARENELPFIASNIPRRYASLVHREGLGVLEDLPKAANIYFAPLPIEIDTTLESYQRIMKMGHGQSGMSILQAQAVKDATMAYFIHQNLKKKGLFLHYNGAFHSTQHEGIVHYLKKLDKGLKVQTITTVTQEKVESLDDNNLGKADFILCVPVSMTKTH